MPIACFWLEPTDRMEHDIHVWCPCGENFHAPVDIEHTKTEDGKQRVDWDAAPWPTHCAACGREHDYDNADREQRAGRSSGSSTYYRRVDTGEEMTARDAPVGAMWDAGYSRKGPDGRSLAVKLPGNHTWLVDSRASNCDRPGDDHYCWVRHGEPPNVTVDKNGDTCTAGGGSVWANSPHGWHGHLVNGQLVEVGEAI